MAFSAARALRQRQRPLPSARRAHSTSAPLPPNVPRPGLGRRAWEAYSDALYRRPLVVKASMAATIFAGSDVALQSYTSEDEVDWSRAARGSAFGAGITAWLHVWWGFLETAVEARVPAARYRLANTLCKVAADQSFGASVYTFCYFFVTGYFRSMDVEVAKDRAVDMLFPTLLKHWRLWPAVHTLNFYFVPLHHRLLVQNAVLVGWSGYLSHLDNLPVDAAAAAGDAAGGAATAGDVAKRVEEKVMEVAGS